MLSGKNYQLSLEQVYETNQLLQSALTELFGDEVKSASLFCLEMGISLSDRDNIILTLNKFADQHAKDDLAFWRTRLQKEVPNLADLSDETFKKMLNCFWLNYVIEE